MPMYDYECPQHGVFSAMRLMKHYKDPHPCPNCMKYAPRVLIKAPSMPSTSDVVRRAHATNERAQHSPMSSESFRSKHGPSCSCCTGNKKNASLENTSELQSASSKRPWMISH